MEDYKKKYEEALKRAKGLKTDEYKDVAEYIFPELAESEDERIRKALIRFLKSPFVNESIADEKVTPWIAWLEKLYEQKPSEDEDREYACQSSEHYTRRELMIYNLGIADGKRMIEDAIKETEQKNDWSEEDEERLKSIISLMKSNRAVNPFYEKMCLENWLKSIKERVHPQKQEWSEEDKKMIGNIRTIIEKYAFSQSAVDVNGDLCEKEYIDADNWLKSLIPQNKTYYWTENEIKFAISDYIRGAESYEKMVEKLRCLKPQNRWKPSTLQIEALESATENCAYSEYQDCLRELAKQLKKL